MLRLKRKHCLGNRLLVFLQLLILNTVVGLKLGIHLNVKFCFCWMKAFRPVQAIAGAWNVGWGVTVVLGEINVARVNRPDCNGQRTSARSDWNVPLQLVVTLLPHLSQEHESTQL